MIESTLQNEERVKDMGIFRRHQKQNSNEYALTNDIVHMMELFGRYEFNPQENANDAADIGQLMGELYPFASTDPDGFLVALAGAVLPVDGWAVYGASRTIWELLSSSASAHQHPSYKAIMSAALEFLRTNGVSLTMLRGYERDHWFASGGTIDSWLPRPPTYLQLATNPTNVPDSPEAWGEAGIAHMQNDRYTEALAAFERALQLAPTYALAYSKKGFALGGLKRYEEAFAAFDRALQLDLTDVAAYAGRSNAFLDLKRYEEALVDLETALQLNPDLVLAYVGKGNALGGLKRYEEALIAYDCALTLDPNNAPLDDLGRYEEALAAYNRALTLAPNNAAVWYHKGNVLIRLGRLEEALAPYDRALDLNPNDADVWFNKGVVLECLRRVEEALIAYDRALDLNPNDPANWHAHARFYHFLGRLREAEAAEQRARELGG